PGAGRPGRGLERRLRPDRGALCGDPRPSRGHARPAAGDPVARADPRHAALMATVSLRDEVVELLGELIRVDTVNPPGNETAAAELLRDYLAGRGVESHLYAKVPDRANLVARLPGRG